MAYNLEILAKNLDEILQLQQQNIRMILSHQSELKFSVLLRKITSLKHLFETTSDIRDKEVETLEGEIRDVSHEADDIIEADRVRNAESNYLRFPTELNEVMDKIEAVRVKLMEIKDQRRTRDDAMAGKPLDVAHSIISSIVGMGGIGKTTLAQEIYNDPLICSHFDTRAWVTVSQDYTVHAILLQLLGCIIGKLSEEMLQAKTDELSLTLYQSLYGKRYLVVVDDIWSEKAWNEMKRFFPKENLKSRILLTTRELDVAKQVDSSCEHHHMHLLNDHHSWELLQRKAFGEESCPPSLEGIGRKIASNCRGLPLAISVIGGVLSENRNMKNIWDQLQRDVGSVVEEKNENFSKILTLSYNHLPYHLKPCFLYMAAYPEDFFGRVSTLVSIWVAEGFLKPIEGKTLEEAAEEYLQALVNRNLLTVQRYKSNGKARSYRIHDLGCVSSSPGECSSIVSN